MDTEKIKIEEMENEMRVLLKWHTPRMAQVKKIITEHKMIASAYHDIIQQSSDLKASSTDNQTYYNALIEVNKEMERIHHMITSNTEAFKHHADVLLADLSRLSFLISQHTIISHSTKRPIPSDIMQQYNHAYQEYHKAFALWSQHGIQQTVYHPVYLGGMRGFFIHKNTILPESTMVFLHVYVSVRTSIVVTIL